MKKLSFQLLTRIFLLLIVSGIVFSSCAGGLSKRESARIYYNLGNAYFELGKNEEASSAYLRALEFDDDLKVASFNLARSYIEAGKYSEALRLLDRMLEKDSENTVIHSAKGYCLFRFGDYDKASESYLNVITINPADQDALFNYALIMTELGNYDTAVEKFAELKNTNPEDECLTAKIDFAVGRVYYLQKNYDKALEYFEPVYENKPDFEGVAGYLFEIYKNKKYYGKMVETGKKLLETDENNRELLFDVSKVLLLEIEDLEEGLDYFRRAVESGFNDEGEITEILENRNLTVRKELEKILENSKHSDD